MDRRPSSARAHDAELARLRAWRVRQRSPNAASLFLAMGESMRRRARAAVGVGAAWESLCPPHLLAHTRIEGVRSGVLTIIVDDAPTRYALERSLRAGLEGALVRAAPTPLRRVRLRLAR